MDDHRCSTICAPLAKGLGGEESVVSAGRGLHDAPEKAPGLLHSGRVILYVAALAGIRLLAGSELPQSVYGPVVRLARVPKGERGGGPVARARV